MVVPSLTLMVGLLLGWVAGRAYQRAAGGWSDYRMQRSKVSLLRTTAFQLSRRAVAVVVLAAILAAIAGYMAASGVE